MKIIGKICDKFRAHKAYSHGGLVQVQATAAAVDHLNTKRELGCDVSLQISELKGEVAFLKGLLQTYRCNRELLDRTIKNLAKELEDLKKTPPVTKVPWYGSWT